MGTYYVDDLEELSGIDNGSLNRFIGSSEFCSVNAKCGTEKIYVLCLRFSYSNLCSNYTHQNQRYYQIKTKLESGYPM